MTNEELLQHYQIIATDRATGKREPISEKITRQQAEEYKPSPMMKKLYKYFKIAKAK